MSRVRCQDLGSCQLLRTGASPAEAVLLRDGKLRCSQPELKNRKAQLQDASARRRTHSCFSLLTRRVSKRAQPERNTSCVSDDCAASATHMVEVGRRLQFCSSAILGDVLDQSGTPQAVAAVMTKVAVPISDRNRTAPIAAGCIELKDGEILFQLIDA